MKTKKKFLITVGVCLGLLMVIPLYATFGGATTRAGGCPAVDPLDHTVLLPRVEINRRFVAKYVSSPTTRGNSTNMVSLKLVDVASVPTVPVVQTRAETKWPTGEEGWFECTAMCYSYAKESCGGDPKCNILCDLVDLAGMCTGAVAIACGAHCL